MPSGRHTITSNGVYDISDYASVDVNVSTSQEDGLVGKTLTTYTNDRVTSIGSYAFYSCSSLTSIDLPNATSIGNNAFSDCYSLTKLIIRTTSQVCTLSNTNAFNNCYHILGTTNATYNPEGLKDGYIYVPDELVESYKTATNWSEYASQIKPLSEYV